MLLVSPKEMTSFLAVGESVKQERRMEMISMGRRSRAEARVLRSANGVPYAISLETGEVGTASFDHASQSWAGLKSAFSGVLQCPEIS